MSLNIKDSSKPNGLLNIAGRIADDKLDYDAVLPTLDAVMAADANKSAITVPSTGVIQELNNNLNSKFEENLKFIQVAIAGTQLISTSNKYYYATVEFTDKVPQGYFPICIFEKGVWDEAVTYMLNINEITRVFRIDIRSAVSTSISQNVAPLNIVCVKML